MRHHKSQCLVLMVTNKNHTKEGLTNHIFAAESHDPPPLPIKLLNRICIDLKNGPNGSEKNKFPLKNGKTHACNDDKNTSLTNLSFIMTVVGQ